MNTYRTLALVFFCSLLPVAMAQTNEVWALRSDTPLATSAGPKYQRNLANHGFIESTNGPPDAPINLVANVASPGGAVIHLSWESAARAESYEVWRAVGADFDQAQLIATNVSTTLRFNDDLTRAGVSYTYWVRGMNAAGRGPFADPVTAKQTNQLWAEALGYYISPAVIAEDGTVYVTTTTVDLAGNRGIALCAISPDGSRLWTYNDDASIPGDPLIAPNGNLIFATGTRENFLQAVTPTGQRAWKIHIRQFPRENLAVAGMEPFT
jgi:hypothetical protein